MFELRRCSSYGGSSNRELLMRIYQEIFTMQEESFELRRSSSNRKSSYRESTVAVSIVGKRVLANKTVNYDTKTKAYVLI